MNDDVRRYTDRLTWELRKRGVPGDVIGDAVAQIESHTAESGERPRAAFGDPRRYTESFAPAAGGRGWAGYALHGLAGFVLAALLAIGLVGMVRNEPLPWGVDPRLVVLIAAAALVVYAVALVVRLRHRIKDPREEQ